jgi:hypothetical protein
MAMDRLCAHALAGSRCGLGLKPETLNRASPSRRRGPRAASARRRSARRRRSTRTSARGTPRRSPRCTWYALLLARRRTLWRTRSAGLRCGTAIGVDRLRLRCAGVRHRVCVQRQHRRVEHRARHLVVQGMRRSRPGGAHYGGRARPGFGVARPVLRGGTADARACAHVQAQACAGPWV